MAHRTCPSCDTLLYYTYQYNANRAEKKGRACRSCAQIGNTSHKGFSHSEESKKKMGEVRKGGSSHNKGQPSPDRGKKNRYTPETLRKMRLGALRRIARNSGQVVPNYNPKACRIIEQYGQDHGYTFQHAENGGEFHIKELGYFVDGYDAEQNVVIEVDEPNHQRQVEKDLHRQQEIQEHLGCTFIRVRIK